MAKLDGSIKFQGTFGEMTAVHSRTYGKHVRAARGTHKPARVNDAMKKSSGVLVAANKVAKAIKDPLDTFSVGFKDGTMWFRLVSFAKRQLKHKRTVNFNALKSFEFNDRNKFRYLFSTKIKASIPASGERTLEVRTQSKCCIRLNRDKANNYQQTLIVLFLDEDYEPTVVSESVILPLRPVEDREQRVTCTIPVNAITAIVIMKGDFFDNNKSTKKEARRRMAVVEVVDLKRNEK